MPDGSWIELFPVLPIAAHPPKNIEPPGSKSPALLMKYYYIRSCWRSQ